MKMFIFLENVFTGDVPSIFLAKKSLVLRIFHFYFFRDRERFLNHAEAIFLWDKMFFWH